MRPNVVATGPMIADTVSQEISLPLANRRRVYVSPLTTAPPPPLPAKKIMGAGAAPSGASWKIVYPDKVLFLKKTLFIVAATYLFIPIMYLHDVGDITGLAYALILVALHVIFIAVYCYRVKLKQLDADNKSLAARILGLLFCVALLLLVSNYVTADSDNIPMLSLILLGLCAVHTLILFLLMVTTEKLESDGTSPNFTEDATNKLISNNV
jgi:hypothetical protein